MALVAFVTDALTMSVLAFALALAVSLAQERLLRRLRASAPAVKRWGGRILVLVGVWLLVLAIFADFFVHMLPL